MANLRDVLKSGVLGLGAAAAARKPELLRAFGLAGNLAAKEFAEKQKAASVGNVGSVGTTGTVAKPMKKGGSASSRADGCAVRGKTKCKMY